MLSRPSAPAGVAVPVPEALSPEAWQSLRYAIARLAIQLVSGPGGLASALRCGLLDAPYNSRSVGLGHRLL
jgi:hypothetical protein